MKASTVNGPHKSSRPALSTRLESGDLLPTLLSISKSVRALTAITVADIGLSVGQDALLVAIAEADHPIVVHEIADNLNVRASTVSKMADRLIEKGLVDRLKDGGDARLTRLGLTDAGWEKADKVRKAWSALQDSLTTADPNLGDVEVQATLDTVEVALRSRLARLR